MNYANSNIFLFLAARLRGGIVLPLVLLISGCTMQASIQSLVEPINTVHITAIKEPHINTPTTLTLRFSEARPDFSLIQLEISNGVVGDLSGGPLEYQVTLTPQVDGVVEVKVKDTAIVSSANTQSTVYPGEVYQLTYDTVVPVISNVTRLFPLTSPSTQTSVQVEATVSEIAYVEFYLNSSCSAGTSIGSATTVAGKANLINSVLASDIYNYHVIAKDLAGNTSICSTLYASYELDLVAPSLSGLGIVVHDPIGSPSSDTTPTLRVSGYNDADVASVTVYSDAACTAGKLYSSGNVSGASIDLTSTTALTDGVYNFYARLTDDLGNTSACSAVFANYILDTGAPAKATSMTLVEPVSSPSNDTTPKVEILGVESGATVKIYRDVACSIEVANGVAASTNIELTTNVLSEGVHSFYVEVIDIVNNSSGCSNSLLTYTVDTTLPATPSLVLHDPATSPNNDLSPTFRVSGLTVGDTVRLYSDNTCDTQIVSSAVSATSMDLTVNLVTEGVYTFYASAIDQAGNKATCSAGASYTLDTTAPASPNSLVLQNPLVSPANDLTPTITVGGVVSGDSVKIYTSNTCAIGQLKATGVASGATINLTSSTLLGEGTYTFYADSTDPAGNTATCSTVNVSYIVDLTAPTDPTNLTLVNPATSPGNDSTPTIRTAGVSVGDVVSLYTTNTCSSAVASGTVAAGNTSIDLELSAALNPDGIYNFYVTVVDASSNSTGCLNGSLSYTLDRVAPVTPASLSLLDPTTSPNNDKTPTVQITGVVATDTVTLFKDSLCTQAVVSGTVAALATTIDLTPATELTDGDYNFYAESRDLAGNTSACSLATVAYKLDTLAPSSSVALSLVAPATSPSNDTTPTMSVSGVAATDVVGIYSDSSCTNNLASGNSVGTSINLTSSALTEGSHTIYALVTDSAGNASGCSTANLAYTVDLTAPDIPVLSLKTPSTSPNNVKRPELNIATTANGDLITIYDNSACGVGNVVTTSTSTGTTHAVTLPSDLADGTYNFYVRSRDPAGNSSGCSVTALQYVLDTGVPSAPLSLTRKNPSSAFGKNRTPEITVGGVENGALVSLYKNNICTDKVGEGAASTTSIDIIVDNNLADGVYNFYAQQKDASGNISNCSTATVSYTVDNTAPSAPTGLSLYDPNSSPGVDSTPTIQVSGVVAGDKIYLYNEVTCSTSVGNADAAGTTVNITSSVLGQGTHNFYAKAIDLAGNESACSTATVEYVYTLARPTVTLTANISGSTMDRLVFINVTVSESVTDFSLGDIVVNGGSAQNLIGSGASYTFEVKNLTSGVVDITIPQDSFVNGLSVGNSISNAISYNYTEIIWKQEAFIKAPNAADGVGDAGVVGDAFGIGVSLSGDTLAVGAEAEDSNHTSIYNGVVPVENDSNQDSGAVYIYKRTNNSWAYQSYIKANNAGSEDYFGYAVSLHGDTLAVGALEESSGTTSIINGPTTPYDYASWASGAVYIYRRSGSTWAQEAYIKAVNAESMDYFGVKVSLSENRLAVIASGEDSNQSTITNGMTASSDNSLSHAGAIYIYGRIGATWVQEAYIKSPNVDSNQWPTKIDLHDETLIVGVEEESSDDIGILNGTLPSGSWGRAKSGAVFVYRRVNGLWQFESYIKAPDADANDEFGHYLSYDDNLLAVGANFEDSNVNEIINSAGGSSNSSMPRSGAVYVYRRTGSTWVQEAFLKPSNVAAEMNFGCSVRVSKNRIAVGAIGESSNFQGIINGEGHSANTASSKSGAVYVYAKYGNTWTQEAYIKPANGVPNLGFGGEISLQGNTLVVGVNKESSSTSGVNGVTNGTGVGSGVGATGSGAAYVYSMNAPIATLNGDLLGKISHENLLSIAVGGSDITKYSYKVGPAGSTNCSDPSGYISVASVATVSVVNLSGYSDGEMVLCVLGENSTGAIQSVGSATIYRWTRDTSPPSVPSAVNDGVTEMNTGAITPTFNWGASTDAAGPIARYEVSLGSSAGATDYKSWSQISSTSTSTSFEGLSVPYGATVYFNVRAMDGAGNISAVGSTDGYTVGCNSSANWCPEAFIKAVNAEANDMFGMAVSVSGDTLAVGTYNESSGTSVIINGSTAESDNSKVNSGAVYIYRRVGSTWTQEAYIKASNSSSEYYFGDGVSLHGDTLIVGSTGESSSQSTITNGTGSSSDQSISSSGAAYVYRRTGNNWAQEAYIKPSNAAQGYQDTFGWRVAVDRNTAVISMDYEDSSMTSIVNGDLAIGDDGLSSSSGAVFVYHRRGVNWYQEAYIKASNSRAGYEFGSALAISGDTVVVGSYRESSSQTGITNGALADSDNSHSNSGAAYVYRRSGLNWNQEAYIKSDNSDYADEFGKYLDISGDTIVVGALKEDSDHTTISNGSGFAHNEGRFNSGAVYIYKRTGNSWAHQTFIKAANADEGDLFGLVKLNGNVLIAGADDDSREVTITQGGAASKDNSKVNSGAIYVYRRVAGIWAQEAFIKASNADAGDYLGSFISVSGDSIVAGSKREDSSGTSIIHGLQADLDNSKTDSGAVYVYRYQKSYEQKNRFIGVDISYSHIAATGNVRIYVEYSDDNSSWVTAKSQNVILNESHIYSLAWDEAGAHRYWRLRFEDPDDGVIGARADKLIDVEFYQLNGKKVLPGSATRILSPFTNPERAEDENPTTEAIWGGANSGMISWDFGI